jgi:hypothetical protein
MSLKIGIVNHTNEFKTYYSRQLKGNARRNLCKKADRSFWELPTSLRGPHDKII